MTFVQALKSVLMENYFNFDGRARRSEYWYFCLLNFLVNFAYNMITRLIDSKLVAVVLAVIVIIYSLGTLIPGLAVAVRRLHDINKSGWWMLIGLIPLIGWVILLIWYCRDSELGSNEYGENPKGL
ncbi:DUF805 domain-containing protein [bacterium]|nr:DUF805 domain-containing protein [bacterium]